MLFVDVNQAMGRTEDDGLTTTGSALDSIRLRVNGITPTLGLIDLIEA